MAHNPSTSFELIRLNPGLSADPASGRAGEIYFNSTTNTMRYFDGSLWTDFGGVWANQNLSNLLTTSINQDLLADATLTRSLGSPSLVWSTASIQGLNQVTTISDLYTSGIQITSQSATGSDNSGNLSLVSGDSVNGATGGILIRSGSPSGGTTVFTQQITDFSTTAFNFDTTTIGTRIAGVQLVAPSNGVLSSITLKLQNATATPDTYTAQLLVYNDISGNPGSIISSSSVQFIPIAGSTTVDQVFTFQFPVSVVSGQTYYFLLTAQSVASTLNLLGSASSVGTQNLTTSTNSGGSWTIAAFPDPYYILFNSPTRGTIDLDGGVARLMNQSPLRFMNPGSTNYVAFKAPTTIGTNVTWTLPNADGTAGQALVTSGGGVLSFTTVTTAPSGPAGAVQFSNGSAFASDSPNFFWDDTNNRLGIGTNAPSMSLHVTTANNNVATLFSSASTGQVNNLILDSNANTGMIIRNNVSTAGLYIGNSGGNTKIYQISNTETSGGSLILRNNTTNQVILNSSNQLQLGAAGLIWPAVDGTSGQALITNGTTTLSWASLALSTGTANTLACYNNSGNLTASGPSYTASINSLSFSSTTATGGRLAFGKTIPGGGPISATNEGTFAFGQASGNGAAEVIASGAGSMAYGVVNGTVQIHATGGGAFAGGLAALGGSITQIVASGDGSFSQGRVTTTGIHHTASGLSAFNTGEGNTTSGNNAFSAGMGHLNGSYATLAMGRWSVATGTAASWVTTDPLFVVGIGASAGSRANAFKIQKDGKLFILDPSLATAVNGYTWKLVDQSTGEGAWSVVASAAPTVEYRTLSSGEAAANQLTLTGTPGTPSKTLADIFSGGGPMEYTAEFTVTGTTFSWSGGVYAGVLVAGDRIRITYWT